VTQIFLRPSPKHPYQLRKPSVHSLVSSHYNRIKITYETACWSQ